MNGFRAPLANAYSGAHSGAAVVALSCLALSCLTLSCSQPLGPVDGDAAYRHAAAICALGPRPSGSPTIAKVGDYLTAQVEALGLTMHEDRWSETHEVYGEAKTVAFRNLWTEIPGEDPENGPILLLAAHYDSKLTTGHPGGDEQNFPFVAALDSAASCGLLLELAGHIKGRDNVPNVWIAWFDGEECLEFEWKRDNSLSLFGSRRFVQQLGADKARFPRGVRDRLRTMVLLDLVGGHELKIDRDSASTERLLDIFGRTAAELGREDVMYRWYSPMTDDHIPFKNVGVAVIDLIDFRWRYAGDYLRPASAEAPADVGPAPEEGTYTAWWHTPEDDMDQVSADSLAFVGNLIWQALPKIEKAFYGE